MAANGRTVGPKAGGGWQVTGGPTTSDAATEAEGEAIARRELEATGGGEIVIKGEDGRIREQNTIGRGDRRESMG